MTVSGLIELLSRFPPDMEVLSGDIPNDCYETPLTFEMIFVGEDGKLRLA